MASEIDPEEMLFGFPISQTFDNELWEDGSDNEMLDAPFDDDDPMLLSTLNAQEQGDSAVQWLEGSTNEGDQAKPDSVLPDRTEVIARIEKMLETALSGFLDGNMQVSIILKSRSSIRRRQPDPLEVPGAVPPPKVQTINFPGSSTHEAWKFTVIVRILELIHGCLIDRTIMTKRDLYYRHADLFVKQAVVDRYVDDLACTFGVPRSLLNVTAAAKGLIAGSFTLRRADGSSVRGLCEEQGILVPDIHEADLLDLSSVHWILVIEKEATFRSLLSFALWKDLRVNGLILTAKGYPDIASRKFLHKLATSFPEIPMFALVDFDPDGIAILSTYKHGSYRLAHEDVTSADTPGLTLPDLQWLGVQSHHINRVQTDEGDTETAALVDVQGLMRLTARDRRKAHQMLGWDLCTEGSQHSVWRAELQRMLILNVKAEMQILDERPGGLATWLSNEIHAKQGLRLQVSSAEANADDDLLF